MTQGRRKLCIETIALFVVGAVFVGVGGFLCITAYRARRADAAAADAADLAWRPTGGALERAEAGAARRWR